MGSLKTKIILRLFLIILDRSIGNMKKYARLRPSSSSNSEKFEEIDNVLYNSRPEESHMKMNRHHHTSNTCSTSSSLQHQDSPVVVVAPSSSSSSLPSRVVPPLPASSTTGPSHTDLAEALKKLASFREGGGSTRWQQQQGGGGGSNSLNGLNGNGLNGDGDGESIHSRSVSGRWPGSGEGGWGAPQDVSGEESVALQAPVVVAVCTLQKLFLR